MPRNAPETSSSPSDPPGVQRVLEGMGFRPESPRAGRPAAEADFWVRAPGTPGRKLPVFSSLKDRATAPEGPAALLARWSRGLRSAGAPTPWGSILVVDGDEAARHVVEGLTEGPAPVDRFERFFVRILVRSPGSPEDSRAHWRWEHHKVRGAELLTLATGTLLGLAQRSRAEGGEEGLTVDLPGMVRELKGTLLVDLEGSLGVESTEDALFLLYQLAQRHGYAPGDQGGSLHELIAQPQSPAARLPWFSF